MARTYNDHLKALDDKTEAETRLCQKIESQGAARQEIQRRLNKLDNDLAPFNERFCRASEVVGRDSKLLIGPWIIDTTYREGNMYRYGTVAEARWMNNYVWLRGVARSNNYKDPRQWEARIRNLTGNRAGNKDIVFGPVAADKDSRQKEFESHMKATEKILVEMGYILYTGIEE